MTEFERGMVMSSMSDESVARTLGRSLAWVVRARSAAKVTVAPPAETVQARAGRRDLPVARPVPRRQPDAPKPIAAPPLVVAPARPAPLHPVPVGAPEVQPLTPSGRPVRRMTRAAAPKTLSVPPRVLRWCRWFLAAGWTPDETARLFDLSRRDLIAALGTRS